MMNSSRLKTFIPNFAKKKGGGGGVGRNNLFKSTNS